MRSPRAASSGTGAGQVLASPGGETAGLQPELVTGYPGLPYCSYALLPLRQYCRLAACVPEFLLYITGRKQAEYKLFLRQREPSKYMLFVNGLQLHPKRNGIWFWHLCEIPDTCYELLVFIQKKIQPDRTVAVRRGGRFVPVHILSHKRDRHREFVQLFHCLYEQQ
jgi:hypothetical protein